MYLNLKSQIDRNDLHLLLSNKRSDKKKLELKNVFLVKKAKQGDIFSRNYLYSLNLPIILEVIKSFKIKDEYIFKDILSNTFDYFLETVERYEFKRNNCFLAFLKLVINSRIKNYFGSKSFKKTMSTYRIDAHNADIKSYDSDYIDIGLSEIEKKYMKNCILGKMSCNSYIAYDSLNYHTTYKLKNKLRKKLM